MVRNLTVSIHDHERSLDITGAETVEISIRSDGKVLWVNVDGTLALRVCRITSPIIIEDERKELNVQGPR